MRFWAWRDNRHHVIVTVNQGTRETTVCSEFESYFDLKKTSLLVNQLVQLVLGHKRLRLDHAPV